MNNNEEVLIKVEGLSKKFCKDLKTSLYYGLKDLYQNIKGNKEVRKLRPKEFWALQDINFELKRGECLGLIGHNGAGKSTLLKILNGLIKPDIGKVTIKGKIGALIELGAGFNPILSGRENIYNNGAILGFTRKEINEKLEEIIDFAEIREFIDMPVQNYSSGMKVRLGFAIAAQMEPDVLIIDEVLAVGDLGFVLKCYEAIDKILPSTAIIFISHNMPMISRICNKIIWFNKGLVAYKGWDVGKGIDFYYSSYRSNDENVVFTDNSLKLENAEVINFDSLFKNIPKIKWGDNLEFKFKFRFIKNISIPRFIFVIYDKENREIAYFDENSYQTELKIIDSSIEFTVKHKRIQLSKGFYTVDVSVHSMEGRRPFLRVHKALTFHLDHPREIFPPFLLDSTFHQL